MKVAAFGRLTALAAGMLIWLATPAAAFAHAGFVRSDPPDLCGPLAVPHLPANDPRCQTGPVLDMAPRVVRITFSEPVQLAGRGIRVLSPSGKPVQQGRAMVAGEQASIDVDAGEPGTYVVDWQVVSADTHPARGRFAFSVDRPSSPLSDGGAEVGQVSPVGLALQAFGRWLHFAGYALAFGTLAVSLLTGSASSANLRRLMNAGILLLLAAEPFALLGQTGSLGLDQMLDGDTLVDALASPFGRLMAFRLAVPLLLWVVSAGLQSPLASPRALQSGSESGTGTDRYAADAAYPAPNPRLAMWTACALGVALAFIDGFGQHAGSFQPEVLGLAVHALHLMAMAMWLGGLAFLAVARTPIAHAGRVLAIPLVAIAASGLAMAVVHIPQPGDVVATTYGQVLASKQLLVIAAAALGWLTLSRRVRRRLRLGELGILTALIGVAGLLVSLPPPR